MNSRAATNTNIRQNVLFWFAFVVGLLFSTTIGYAVCYHTLSTRLTVYDTHCTPKLVPQNESEVKYNLPSIDGSFNWFVDFISNPNAGYASNDSVTQYVNSSDRKSITLDNSESNTSRFRSNSSFTAFATLAPSKGWFCYERVLSFVNSSQNRLSIIDTKRVFIYIIQNENRIISPKMNEYFDEIHENPVIVDDYEDDNWCEDESGPLYYIPPPRYDEQLDVDYPIIRYREYGVSPITGHYANAFCMCGGWGEDARRRRRAKVLVWTYDQRPNGQQAMRAIHEFAAARNLRHVAAEVRTHQWRVFVESMADANAWVQWYGQPYRIEWAYRGVGIWGD